MHFGHLNVNSLLSKIDELRTLAINSNISVLGITETKLDINEELVSNEELKRSLYPEKYFKRLEEAKLKHT